MKTSLHANESGFARYEQRDNEMDPYELPPQCYHCGSLHPHDVLAALRAGATIELADMKYGWPHKFYLTLPNPKAGKLVKMGTISLSHSPTIAERARFQKWRHEGDAWYGERLAPAPKEAMAKFYSEHMRDCDEQCFAELAERLHSLTGVLFSLRPDGSIGYTVESRVMPIYLKAGNA